METIPIIENNPTEETDRGSQGPISTASLAQHHRKSYRESLVDKKTFQEKQESFLISRYSCLIDLLGLIIFGEDSIEITTKIKSLLRLPQGKIDQGFRLVKEIKSFGGKQTLQLKNIEKLFKSGKQYDSNDF